MMKVYELIKSGLGVGSVFSLLALAVLNGVDGLRVFGSLLLMCAAIGLINWLVDEDNPLNWYVGVTLHFLLTGAVVLLTNWANGWFSLATIAIFVVVYLAAWAFVLFDQKICIRHINQKLQEKRNQAD